MSDVPTVSDVDRTPVTRLEQRLPRWIRTEASRPPLGPAIVATARGAVQIMIWAVLTITVLLGSWVAFGWTLARWEPVTITSGSMEPALREGDVLMIDTDADRSVGQRSIVVFERDGELVAHRVFAVDGDMLVTKGDANAVPDSDRVAADELVGVGRLVVPLVGRPVLWADRGQWVPFVVWAALVFAGLARLALSAERLVSRRRWRDTMSLDHRHEVGRRGVQRVRVVVAVLVAVQYVIGRDEATTLVGREALTGMAIAVLLGTNLLGSIGERAGRAQSRSLALVELAIDTGLVVTLVMSTRSSGSTWVLLSLPIIEAAVRFRLVGALVHWMLMTTLSAGTRIWQGAGAPSTTLLADLDRIVDQLSVLFLVVVPAAYLAEQLIGEVRTWQESTALAAGRSELLVRVADLSRDISRLDGTHVDVILQGARSLGFDRADMVVDDGTGGWQVIGGDSLPVPGGPAGCVDHDGLGRGVFVDADDPDETEAMALEAAGLHAVVAQAVSIHEGRRVVLRVGVQVGRLLSHELVEAFRLFAGQVSVALRNDQLVGELTAMHADLQRQALHDALTGLPNRALLMQRLDQVARSGTRPALLFLDLNGFKPVNDRLGHEAGDVVLQRVGQRLVEALPPEVTVARLGGDEFTVLLPVCDDERVAVALASTVAQEISRPFELEQGLVDIGTAIGIAFGGAGVSTTELLRRADVAMYQAKHGGGELPYETYRPEFDGETDRRDVLLRDIPAAIASGDVRLVFQPVVDVSFGSRPIGAEALVRWRHPTVGEVSSREIVDTARDAGLLTVFSEHVLRLACRAAAQWNAAPSGPPCFVAVNASVEELAETGFGSLVQRMLFETRLPASLLHLEVGEKVVVDTSPAIAASFASIRALGVRIVLDDVGQVNLSMSSLHAESLSGVKIDRRLVTNAMRSETDRLVLRSVVELSHRLGHLVVVGGIESEQQVDLVRSVGCTTMQGYHLGVPGRAEDIARSLVDDGHARPDASPVLAAPVSAPAAPAAPWLPASPAGPSLFRLPDAGAPILSSDGDH